MTDPWRESYADEELRKFDPFVHAVTVVQEQHRLSHDGMMFHGSGKVLAIANAASQDFLIAAGTLGPHLQRVAMGAGAGDIDILVFEGTTTTADGTPDNVQNVNRRSTRVATAVLTLGPTITDDGELIHTGWIPPTAGGVGNAEGVIDVRLGEEWLCIPDTKYLVRVTNNSGGPIDLRFEFVWYEIDYPS